MEELLKKHKQEKKELQGKLEIDERERERLFTYAGELSLTDRAKCVIVLMSLLSIEFRCNGMMKNTFD